jgi:hypothetical protein
MTTKSLNQSKDPKWILFWIIIAVILLAFLNCQKASSQQLTTSAVFEPIGTAVGFKIEYQPKHQVGFYGSYTQGIYKMPFYDENITFNKKSIGIAVHNKSGAYLQGGLVYSCWDEVLYDDYIFTKHTTPELGFGFKFPRGFNVSVRYNFYKCESALDFGYTFKLW